MKLAFELSVRFYLILIFLPFFLLGFWLKFLRERYASQYQKILLIIVIFLMVNIMLLINL